jgi:hypothetical protein
MPAGYYNMSAAVAEQYQLLAATNVMQYKRCNCKKAKCLKLYCVCFAAGEISCLLSKKMHGHVPANLQAEPSTSTATKQLPSSAPLVQLMQALTGNDFAMSSTE